MIDMANKAAHSVLVPPQKQLAQALLDLRLWNPGADPGFFLGGVHLKGMTSLTVR